MADLAIFKGGKLPAHIRNLGLDKTTKSLMGGAGSGKRISIEGGVWRLLAGGQEVAQREERTLNVVIVAAAEHVGRMYYANGYEKGVVVQPTCWSSDGVTPDDDVEEPQSDKCATCPHNVKGSGPNGTKACRFFQRIAVILDNDLEGDIYQLQLPATSIFGEGEAGKYPLHQYAKLLAAHEVPITAVVTEMRFDTSAAVPKVVFKPARVLEPDELEIALRQGQTDDAQNAVEIHPGHKEANPEEDDGKPVHKPTVKPRKAAKPAAPEPVEEEEIEEVEEVEEEPAPAPRRVVKRKAAPVVEEEIEEVEEEPAPAPRRRAPVVEAPEEIEEVEEVEEEPAPAPRKTRAPVVEEAEEVEEEPAPRVRPKHKPQPDIPVQKNDKLLAALDEWDD